RNDERRAAFPTVGSPENARRRSRAGGKWLKIRRTSGAARGEIVEFHTLPANAGTQCQRMHLGSRSTSRGGRGSPLSRGRQPRPLTLWRPCPRILPEAVAPMAEPLGTRCDSAAAPATVSGEPSARPCHWATIANRSLVREGRPIRRRPASHETDRPKASPPLSRGVEAGRTTVCGDAVAVGRGRRRLTQTERVGVLRVAQYRTSKPGAAAAAPALARARAGPLAWRACRRGAGTLGRAFTAARRR